MSSLASSIPQTIPQPRTELWCRRLLWMFAAVAFVCILFHLAMLFWAQNAFSGPESVVSAQSQMLAHDGTLYYDLNRYPYTVSAYTPIFYLTEAALRKAGLPALAAGRLISFGSLIGIVILIWGLTMLYTGDRYCAWTAALLAASTSLLLNWGTIGQVDTLAACFAMAAFWQFSKYLLRGDKALVTAGIFATLAFFTKQTMVACPLAIFVVLLIERPRAALRFGIGLAAVVAGVALGINGITQGHFFANTARANLNPFALSKLKPHFMVLIGVTPMMVVVLAGAKPAWRAGRALFLYLGFAGAIFLLTAAKIGSDTNYQIEFTILLILCACLALHSLDFFPLTFGGSKHWITLLQIPLAVHLVLNFRITTNILLTRVAIEQQFRAEISALKPYVNGRLLSTDYNASERLRGSIEVETLIYGLLVRAGVVDPTPVRRDIAAESFGTIILFEDAHHPAAGRDLEISALPEAQMEEIRLHYKLAAHIPGPYSDGVYVYQPIPSPR